MNMQNFTTDSTRCIKVFGHMLKCFISEGSIEIFRSARVAETSILMTVLSAMMMISEKLSTTGK